MKERRDVGLSRFDCIKIKQTKQKNKMDYFAFLCVSYYKLGLSFDKAQNFRNFALYYQF